MCPINSNHCWSFGHCVWFNGDARDTLGKKCAGNGSRADGIGTGWRGGEASRGNNAQHLLYWFCE